MKISELSARSKVPIPSIKLYIREGLLGAGRRTAKNQALYSEAHLEQLLLIRTLRDTLDMPLAQIASVVANQASSSYDRFEHGLNAALPAARARSEETPEHDRMWALLSPVMKKLGWVSARDAVAVRATLDALVVIAREMPGMLSSQLIERYARVVVEIASFEIPDDWNPAAAVEGSLRYAVLGTLLFEPLLLSLRRVAHGERSRKLTSARGETTCVEPQRTTHKKKRVSR